MPFRFVYVCDLLDKLNEVFTHDPPFLSREVDRLSPDVVTNWFKTHRKRIDDADGAALLSTLLPERRTDRVYELKEKSLEKVIARILALPNSRRIDLERWRQPGAGDLGDCVGRVKKMAETSMQAQSNAVSVEEVDDVLSVLASRSHFSSPHVQASNRSGRNTNAIDLLSPLYLRLQARESMWLTRLILKRYLPVIVPERSIYSSYHYLLPALLKIQAEFPAAINLLRAFTTTNRMSSQIHFDVKEVMENLKPVVGVKIGRPPFFKARSIKHCIDMIQNRRMSIEKKYDGEYCQIHIDLSKSNPQQIKIFSKSGKDSTWDRHKVHRAIRESLSLGTSETKIRKQCILEAELVVFSDKDQEILDFYAIRKHVTRSGVFLGTDCDSPVRDYEHLMIVYFDLLLHDDNPVLNLKHCERIQALETIVSCIPGRAILAERQTVFFSQHSSAATLRKTFAESITTNSEGLVLKPTDEPYFTYESGNSFRSCCIKMKKDYIGSFGDVGDFAVVGASYDAVKAKGFGIPGLQWTDFYVACLENKEDVLRWAVRPRFRVVAIVTPSKEITQTLKHHWSSSAASTNACDHFDLHIEKGIASGRMPTVTFPDPFVFDIHCFSFHKEGNTRFWTMRFPTVTKLHLERSFMDTISFTELQDMAKESRSIRDCHSQEDLHWIKELEGTDPRGVAVDASTPRSKSASSPAKSQQNICSSFCSHFVSTEGDDPRTPNLTTPPFKNQRHITLNDSRNQPSSSKRKIPADCLPIDQAKLRKRVSEDAGVCSPSRSTVTSQLQSSPLSEIFNEASPIRTRRTDRDSFEIANRLKARKRRDSTMESYPTPAEESEHVEDKTRTSVCSPSDSEHNYPTPTFENRPMCHLRSQACALIHCRFLLAPCISQIPWLSEDLLSTHGSFFTSDISEWMKPLRGPRGTRRIILVEANRKDATTEFLRKLETLLRGRNGEGERVAVYDWHLLVDVTRLETERRVDAGVWRRFWVGCI